MHWEGRGGREGERGSCWNSLQVNSFVSGKLRADPPSPQLAQARGQQENELLVPAGCGAKCEGGEWGLSKCRVWLELESQDGSLGMPGSQWSVALCEWDGRLMVGVPLGPGHPRLEGWDPEKAWRCQQGLP